MRRKKDTLIPIEVAILQALLGMKIDGTEAAHGFLIAKLIQDKTGDRQLTAHGTLYRALHRLERAGYLASFWEDPSVALEAGRPIRKFYRVTTAGEEALASADSANSPRSRLNPGGAAS